MHPNHVIYNKSHRPALVTPILQGYANCKYLVWLPLYGRPVLQTPTLQQPQLTVLLYQSFYQSPLLWDLTLSTTTDFTHWWELKIRSIITLTHVIQSLRRETLTTENLNYNLRWSDNTNEYTDFLRLCSITWYTIWLATLSWSRVQTCSVETSDLFWTHDLCTHCYYSKDANHGVAVRSSRLSLA